MTKQIDGDNWRAAQLRHWRRRGIECLGPSATEILMHIIDGTNTVLGLARVMDLSASATQAHVRRLRGLGLVTWTVRRGDTIKPNCVYIPLVDAVPYDDPAWDIEWPE